MDQELKLLIQKAMHYEKSLPEKMITEYVDKPLASFIDCALHNPEATPTMIENLCMDARKYQFATVFVNPLFISLVKRRLEGSDVHVGSVVGFPLGAYPTIIKVEEATSYIEMGADEIDMVMAVGMLKAGEYEFVYNDIKRIVDVVHHNGKRLKVILETALLSDFEKILACLISKEAGADFVKTSTGFSTGGATVADIDLMRRVVGPPDEMGVKAAGGIHSYQDVMRMIQAGANRIGARVAVKIIEEYHQKVNK
jgi:deoxyribose-phosphate aldolase